MTCWESNRCPFPWTRGRRVAWMLEIEDAIDRIKYTGERWRWHVKEPNWMRRQMVALALRESKRNSGSRSAPAATSNGRREARRRSSRRTATKTADRGREDEGQKQR